MSFDHLFFKRGYLLTGADLSRADGRLAERIRSGWRSEPAGGLTLYYDPENRLHSSAEDGVRLLLLGTVIDPVTPLGDPSQIVRRMRELYSKSDEDFFDYLDALSGRFVLVVVSPSRWFVLHDAAGMRSVFYDRASREVTVSSHSALIAELNGYEIGDTAAEFMATHDYMRGRRHFPGLLTPYAQVRMLTPNTLLDLRDRTVERYFPRSPLGRGRVTDDLVRELAGLLKTQVDLLSKDYSLSVSLTGGNDSRTTLAAARDHRDEIFCFTYVEEDAHRPDADTAAELCRRLGLRHVVYDVTPETCGEDLGEYMEVWRRSTARMRADSQGRISKVLHDRYPEGVLHLKSNVSEVGRVSYRSGRKVLMPGRVEPAVLARLYGINSGTRFVLGAFEDYVREVEFDRDIICDYDIYDIFHWEYRLGTWQSLQILDFDTSHDTFILYNNRHILKKLLSVPFRDRLRGTLHRRVMERLWPEVLETPFIKDAEPWYSRKARTVAKEAKYFFEKTFLR